MKQVILIKQHSSVQLAHLYEHLYCMQLRNLFFGKQLFEYLDFSLSGITFDQGGLIEITIELHTERAIKLANQMAVQSISLDRQIISLAFSQLIAEEEQAINVSSYEAVASSLVDLDKQPWQNIDDFDIFQSRDVRLNPYPMHLAKNSHLASRKITLNFVLDTDFAAAHQELIPLFRQVTRLLAYATRYQIAAREGLYADGITFISRSSKVYTKTLLRVANGNDVDVDVDDFIRQCQSMFRFIKQTDAFERLVRILHATSYRNNPYDAPNTYDSYEETSIYLGSKGWKATTTLESCNLLLAHTTIEVAFGRKTTATRVELDPDL